MRPPRYALLAVAALLALPLLAPAASAAPPPENVCGVCGASFERSAERLGVDAIVAQSDLDVRVRADGDSRWTARATVNRAAAERFAANRTLLERAVRETYASHRTVVDDPRNLSVALDGRTITATFAVENVTQRYPGDVLLFDAVASDRSDGNPRLDADEATIRGPSGTVVTRAPDGASNEGNQSVWAAGGTVLVRDSVVVFAPDDGAVSQAATAAAVRWRGLEAAAPGLRAFAAVPSALLALVAAGLLLAGGRLPAAVGDPHRTIRGLAVGAALYVAVAVAGGLVSDGVGFALAAVGALLAPQAFLTAATLLAVGAVDALSRWDRGRVAVGAVASWTLALVLGAPASAALALLAGALVFLPFGFLAGAGRPARLWFPVVAALGPAATALPFVDQVGLLLVSPAMLAAHAAATAALGVPLFAAGRRLGGAETSAERDAPDAAATG
ncbi:hypothetical protein [Halomicrobium salinisoli]|uniref:hypothetical protein n=1 Tax=Halomicrobium salinisoli TaxID=2878391 RepID=UPI001CF04018|nr:hypothetical protein [Halomicrobium salinisoli]